MLEPEPENADDGTRRMSAPCDVRRYRERIERLFDRLKQARRIATRDDRTAVSHIAFLRLAASRIRPKHSVDRP
ncbi:MAG: hypothetical protein ABW179_03900 [Methylobacterium sp.]